MLFDFVHLADFKTLIIQCFNHVVNTEANVEVLKDALPLMATNNQKINHY